MEDKKIKTDKEKNDERIKKSPLHLFLAKFNITKVNSNAA